jgi:hypothetical protein
LTPLPHTHPPISRNDAPSQELTLEFPTSTPAPSPTPCFQSPLSHQAPLPCCELSSADLASLTLLRDECCRGLPGDALSVSCSAGPLSLSAMHQCMASLSDSWVHQTDYEILIPPSMSRDECRRGLPGDAPSILCKAGPRSRSLSAPPQSITSQNLDANMPQSNQLRSHSSAPTRPTLLLPLLLMSGLHHTKDHPTSLLNHQQKIQPRVECCRGLPSDAPSIFCRAGPLESPSNVLYPDWSTHPTPQTF